MAEQKYIGGEAKLDGECFEEVQVFNCVSQMRLNRTRTCTTRSSSSRKRSPSGCAKKRRTSKFVALACHVLFLTDALQETHEDNVGQRQMFLHLRKLLSMKLKINKDAKAASDQRRVERVDLDGSENILKLDDVGVDQH